MERLEYKRIKLFFPNSLKLHNIYTGTDRTLHLREYKGKTRGRGGFFSLGPLTNLKQKVVYSFVKNFQ